MRKICIVNQKGGVGKTTTAVNLASGLARAGKKVLLVDMDPQTNATFALIGLKQPSANMYTLLSSEACTAPDVIMATNQSKLDLLPSDIDLAGAEGELFGAIDGRTRLRAKLNGAVSSDYDFLVIDAPPSLGMLTINALSTGEEVIIPIEPSVFGLHGISQLIKTITLAKEHLNCPNLEIRGVLRTKFENTNVARDTSLELEKHFGDKLFKTIIPKNIKLEEAHSRAKSIYSYAPDSSGAKAYTKFVEEVMAYGN